MGQWYVDFLKQIHEALAPLNRRLIFWGDIGGTDPKAVASLPKDMIAVPWELLGYQGIRQDDRAPLPRPGIETWVLSGDANWKEVYPIAETASATFRALSATASG